MNNNNEEKLMWIVWLVIWVALFSLVAILILRNREKNESDPILEIVEDGVVLTDDSELSVQPKEMIIHQYTEAELQEQEYFDSLEMLAICVEAEAGNQDLMGKRLVVDVILNRVDSDKFPDDILAVISQTNQFSSYSDGQMDRIYEPSEDTFKAVRMELENRTDDKILFFTEGDYNPYCTPAYQHGDHYFGY
jgi:N-acetylmuramoyl-L-alanine amidase